ncbi:Hpt domain-containing protein [Arthrobacter sp. C152]
MPEPQALFNPQPIRTLALHVASTAIAYRFLTDYFDMLPGRAQRLLAALRDEDDEAAMDALLSLKTASAMTGAVDLESRCMAIQTLIAAGLLELARAEAQGLSTAAAGLAAQAAAILEAARAEG